MQENSKFVIMKHRAVRAGEHVDLRYRLPDSITDWGGVKVEKKNLWASYATRKPIPLEPGKKILMFSTTLHTKYQAELTGVIKDGYGKGKLELWDNGPCTILKHSERHIVIEFQGSVLKGIYHFIQIKFDEKTKQNSFLFFKGKSDNISYDGR